MRLAYKHFLWLLALLAANVCFYAQDTSVLINAPKAGSAFKKESLVKTVPVAVRNFDPPTIRCHRYFVRSDEFICGAAVDEGIPMPENRSTLGTNQVRAANGSRREPGTTDEQYQEERRDRFAWSSAFIQSGILLGIQHAFRFTEEKTRKEVGGQFFHDWGKSVGNLRGWNDGGKFFTNYIAHPMQGAVSGMIFVNNSSAARRQTFGWSSRYWTSRMKALVWSFVWSAQFELGPISESSLGNVGQHLTAEGKSKMTYVDLVITPTAGTGMLVAEDVVDRYVLKNWIEKGSGNRMWVRILRTLFTPMKSFSNVLRWKPPWYRDYRH